MHKEDYSGRSWLPLASSIELRICLASYLFNSFVNEFQARSLSLWLLQVKYQEDFHYKAISVKERTFYAENLCF